MEKEAETQYELNASDYLRQLDPDKNFYERIIDTSPQGKEEILYKKITVDSVWVTTAWNKYQMHVAFEGELGYEEWGEDITREQFQKFIEYKGNKRRLNLFTKIFKGNIVIKKTPAKKHIDIRVTAEFYAKLSKDAERCKMTLSDYCRDHLRGKTPKAALSDDEQKMMVELVGLRLDLKNFRSAMIAKIKGMSQEERLNYLVEGQSLSKFRVYLNESIKILEKYIDKIS